MNKRGRGGGGGGGGGSELGNLERLERTYFLNVSYASFIQSFKRFILRCGFPDNVTSDNRSNFVSDDSRNLIASRFTEWYLNLSLAPWCGGFFERENVKKKCKGFINQVFKE